LPSRSVDDSGILRRGYPKRNTQKLGRIMGRILGVLVGYSFTSTKASHNPSAANLQAEEGHEGIASNDVNQLQRIVDLLCLRNLQLLMLRMGVHYFVKCFHYRVPCFSPEKCLLSS
jgi:hypothetical protein